MPQTPNDDVITFTPEEVERAVEQEEAERLAAENATLKQRVVTLRAMINRLQRERAEASAPTEQTDEDLHDLPETPEG